MNFDKRHPYYRKLWWRTKLPWFFIERGFAAKGEDCEHVNADHPGIISTTLIVDVIIVR
ncbi:hypothetical protein D3C71_461970 [compost metagenome]